MPIPERQNPETPKSVKVRIYEALRDWIIDGTLKPGERIIDTDISRYFAVSRTPVREALQILAEQKVIEIFPGRESRVSTLDSVDIPETYRILAELYCLALEFAYPHINDDVIAELKEINSRLDTSCTQRDTKASRTNDRDFHQVFVRLSKNEFLSDFTEILSCHIARIENIYYREIFDVKNTVEEHNRIIAALENHDIDAARKEMHYNWVHTTEILAEKGIFTPKK